MLLYAYFINIHEYTYVIELNIPHTWLEFQNQSRKAKFFIFFYFLFSFFWVIMLLTRFAPPPDFFVFICLFLCFFLNSFYVFNFAMSQAHLMVRRSFARLFVFRWGLCALTVDCSSIARYRLLVVRSMRHHSIRRDKRRRQRNKVTRHPNFLSAGSLCEVLFFFLSFREKNHEKIIMIKHWIDITLSLSEFSNFIICNEGK